ncbi:hypothetical protein KXV85_003356, partial [Aspergillus fumigatus]
FLHARLNDALQTPRTHWAHYPRKPSRFQNLGAYPRPLAGPCVLSAARSVPELWMFSVFVPSDFSLKKAVAVDLAALPESAVWIDLVKPTAEEDKAVERLAGIAVPTREDMQEIEISSRLYIENGARYMTATLM